MTLEDMVGKSGLVRVIFLPVRPIKQNLAMWLSYLQTFDSPTSAYLGLGLQV